VLLRPGSHKCISYSSNMESNESLIVVPMVKLRLYGSFRQQIRNLAIGTTIKHLWLLNLAHISEYSFEIKSISVYQAECHYAAIIIKDIILSD
jgi:hypothetical protein